MQNVDVRDTRNFALIGHAADGKTSLGEALLFRAGATHQLGKVEDGSSVLNHLPEEAERHTTLAAKVYGFDWEGRHLTLVDTPGDPNFQAQGQIALHALDAGVLVVSAVEGAKVGTERMWRTARDLGLPLLAFVNGLDRDRADFAAAVESLEKIGAKAVPIVHPVGTGPGLQGIVDLVSMRLHRSDGDADVPADVAEAAQGARQALLEAVAECDDALLEKYLEQGELGEDEFRGGLVRAVRAGELVPVLGGVATANLGSDLLLRAICELLPSPADRPPARAQSLGGGEAVELTADPGDPFAARVFKTVIDRYAGTLSIFRVVSGSIKADEAILDASTGARQRLGKLFVLRGSENVEVPEAGPGDVVAVAKLKDVHTGNALTREKNGVRLPEIPIPQGVLAYAIRAKAKGDEDKVFAALGKLVEEDPTLHLVRDEHTGEFLLTGMGELHIRTGVEHLKTHANLEVELRTPKVPYRETVTRKAEHVEGKLKKQTGGKGMFGVCYLTVEPLPRGEGWQFVDEIVGGAIPRNLIPAVEKGIQEAAQAGPLAGYPVVDFRVRCVDGKFHSVDSNEMAFKLAGSMGFKAAVEQARPVLLEPIMEAEIVVPDESVGDVMGDVSSRRGRVQTTEARGSGQVVKAQVPMAEMLEYASVLNSLTGGKGAFHMEFSHYDEVPAQARERIVAEAKAAEKAD